MPVVVVVCPNCRKPNRVSPHEPSRREDGPDEVLCVACGARFGAVQPDEGRGVGDGGETRLRGESSGAADAPAAAGGAAAAWGGAAGASAPAVSVRSRAAAVALVVGFGVLLTLVIAAASSRLSDRGDRKSRTTLSTSAPTTSPAALADAGRPSEPAGAPDDSPRTAAVSATTAPLATTTSAASGVVTNSVGGGTSAPATESRRDPSAQAGPSTTRAIEAGPEPALPAVPGAIAATRPGIARPPPSPVPQRVAARGRRPAVMKFPVPLEYGVDDEMIEQTIRQAIDFLAKRYTPSGRHHTGDPGSSAIGIYAFAQAGLAVGDDDDRLRPGGALMDRLFDTAAQLELGKYAAEVYARGLRASCLALYNRPQDRPALEDDVNALLRGHVGGAYGYRASQDYATRWADLSNSQFGLLGMWSAADAGVEVPDEYWRTVEQFWESKQLPDGGWPYAFMHGGPARTGDKLFESSMSMTAAGVASLFVTRDRLARADRTDRLGQPSLTRALERGIRWMDRAMKADHKGYDAFSIERVGLASGFKHFGGIDWYRAIAAALVRTQHGFGGWGERNDGPPIRNGVIDRPATYTAAFNLLFLAKGRHPILFNKLRFDGHWGNRPLDLSGLAPWVSRQFERPLNWQVVSADAAWHEWTDSPVLYIASHKAPRLSDEQVDKLRAFADAGGLIFTHADGSMPEFDDFVTALARRLYPAYEYVAVPPGHPLYSLVFKVDWQKAPLRAISNGSRLLMVHSRTDLAKYWQWRDAGHNPHAFQIAANLHVYAAGKSELRNRLASAYLPVPGGADRAKPTLRMARVRYAGNWDPEPGAWARFRSLLRYRTGYWLNPEPVEWRDLDARRTPLAHLTGTATYTPTEAEVAALRRYVEGGGVVLIDDCGGGGAFTNGLRDALAAAFGNDPTPLPSEHPLLSKGPPGMADVTDRVYRRFTIDLMRGRKPPPLEVIYAGKGTVLLSRLDVASGLLGSGTWGILGYASKWSEPFVQNLVLWTLDGQPTVAPSPATTPAAL